MRLRSMRPQVAFAAVLALVGAIVSAPVLLDDLVMRSGYLFRSSEQAIQITSAVMLDDQPRIKLSSGTISLPPSFSHKPRAGEALAALLKGGKVRLELANPIFEIDLTAPPGDEELRPGAVPGFAGAPSVSGSPMLSAISDVTFERLSIKDGTVRIAFKARPAVVLEDFNGEIIVKRKTALRFKGQFRYRGENVSFDATLGSRLERRGAFRVPIKAQLWADKVNASFEGRLDWRDGPMLTATSADISVSNLRALARWLGAEWPSGAGLMDFEATGALDWSDGVLAMRRGQVQLDGNEAVGALQLDVNGERPALTATLAADSVDLSPYFQGPGEDGAPAGSLLDRVRALKTPAPPLLGYLDADVRLSAEKMTLGSFSGQHLAAGITLNDARLLIDLAGLTLPENGDASGNLTVDARASPPTFALRTALGHVDLSSASTLIAGTELITGTGDLSANLKTSGQSGMDLLSRLDGTIGVALPAGGGASCSLESIMAAAQSDPPGAADPCATHTPLGPATLAVKLSQGVVVVPGFTGGLGTSATKVSGSVDLVTKILDLKLERPRADGTAAKAQDGPVTMRGRPESIKITLPARSGP